MKKYRPLIFIILMFFIGILAAILSYHGYLLKFGTAISSFPWYYIVVTILLGIFINIAAHELGHLVVLKKNGISIRAIYVLFLTVSKDKRWRIGIYPKLLLLFGGLVIPNIPLIETDEEYEVLKDNFSKGIKAGPIMSKYFGILTIVLFIISMIFDNRVFISTTFYLMIVSIIMTYLVLLASKASYENLHGDFVAYEKLNNDPRFALTYILSGVETSDYEKENKNFLWSKVLKELDRSAEIYTLSGQEFVIFYLDEIIFNGRTSLPDIDERIKRVHQYIDTNKEEHYVIANMLLYFYYIKNFDYEFFEIEKTLNKFNSDKIEEKVLDFWSARTKYLLNIDKDERYKTRIYDSYKLNWILKPLRLEPLEEKPLEKEIMENIIDGKE